MLPSLSFWLEGTSHCTLLVLSTFHSTHHLLQAFSPLQGGKASYLPTKASCKQSVLPNNLLNEREGEYTTSPIGGT